jgi:hypothetical protein
VKQVALCVLNVQHNCQRHGCTIENISKLRNRLLRYAIGVESEYSTDTDSDDSDDGDDTLHLDTLGHGRETRSWRLDHHCGSDPREEDFILNTSSFRNGDIVLDILADGVGTQEINKEEAIRKGLEKWRGEDSEDLRKKRKKGKGVDVESDDSVAEDSMDEALMPETLAEVEVTEDLQQ